MGFFNFKKAKEKEEEKALSRVVEFFMGIGGKKSPKQRNKEELLAISHKNPWLYLAVDIIARNIASAEFYLEETFANGTVEEITDHPILDLINEPNPLLIGYTQKYINQAFLDIVGEVLLILDRNEKGEIVAMFPISSSCIKKMPKVGDPYWELKFGSDSIEVYITEVIYIKTPDLNHIYGRGAGKAQALGDEISIHELSGKQISQYFFNNAIPEYLIALDGAEEEEAVRLKDDWLNKNQGWAKRYAPHFVSGKMMIEKLQSEFKDMELNNLRKDQKDNIMQFYQIPPELYGKTQDSNKATSNVAETNFAKQVVVPRLDFMVLNYNVYLVPEFQTKNTKLKLKYRNVVPRDREYDANTKQKFQYAYNLNELRALTGSAPVEGFNEIYPVPMGIQLKKFSELTVPEQEIIRSFKKKNLEINKDVEESLDTMLGQLSTLDLADKKFNEDVIEEYFKLIDQTAMQLEDELNLNLGFEIIENPNVIDAINDRVGLRIAQIDDTLINTLRQQMVLSGQMGETIPELMKRLQQNVFKDYKEGYKLERIARTETMTTLNYATQVTYEQGGVPQKEWIATLDDRVRENHLLMDGQIVNVNEEFESPEGNTTIAPGQFGIADEDINCRCTMGAVFNDKAFSTKQEYINFWTKQDSLAEDAEDDFADAYSKRFAKIQRAINKFLRKL